MNWKKLLGFLGFGSADAAQPAESDASTNNPKRPRFQTETLEQRVYMSATWADVDTGEEISGPTAEDDHYTGTSGGDTANGGAGNDLLEGLDGGDNLFGDVGNDTLLGGGGNDSLTGGAGADVLDGGAGNDTLNADSADTVRGGEGYDYLNLSGTSFTLDAEEAGIEYVNATSMTGTVTVDAAGKTDFGLDYHGGYGSDLVTGSEAADTLRGNAGNDTLLGGAGNDNMFGGAGADVLDGGAGNDTLNADTLDTVRGGEGYDYLNMTGVDVTFDANASSVEYLNMTAMTGTVNVTGEGKTDFGLDYHGGSGSDLVTGSEAADTLRGNAGNDTLLGGAGNDNMFGGAGADVLDGGAGNDTLNADTLDTVRGGEGYDYLNMTGVDVTFDANAASVEYLNMTAMTGTVNVTGEGKTDFGLDYHGGYGADVVTGTAQADTLRGNAGNDTLLGGAGNDNMFGGAGADVLDGGAGNDTLNADTLDTVRGGEGYDYLNMTGVDVTFDANAASVEYLNMTAMTGTVNVTGEGKTDSGLDYYGGYGADIVTGTAQADTLRGNAGNDTLLGGAGNDNLIGGVGADILDGGAGNDTLNADTLDTVRGGEGYDYLNMTGVDVTFDANAASVEYLNMTAMTGTVNVTGEGKTDYGLDYHGGYGSDIVTGTAQADTLRGNAGNDTLRGGAGNDALYGGIGDDTLVGGAGNDTLVGESGNDIAVFSGNRSEYTIINDGNGNYRVVDNLGRDGTDNVQQVERIRFADQEVTLDIPTAATAASQTVTGNDSSEHMVGGTGNDVLTGNGGSDTLIGGAGADKLYGGDGNDNLYVDAADTVIDAGAGWDAVRFQGEGDFTLNVTEANAEHVEGSLFGKNVLDATGKTDSQANLYGGLNDDTLRGSELGDYLQGGLGNDVISGNAGHDTIFGNEGADKLYGGDGNDNLYVDAADTVIDGGAGWDAVRFQGEGDFTLNVTEANAEHVEGSLFGKNVLDATGKTDYQANLYGGLNDDTLRGSELGDYLQGGLGNDVISGNAGHDTIFGNEGADKLYGGDGNDNLYVDAADTVIDGGAGWDAVRFQGEGDLTLNVTQANVEHVEGSLFGKNVLDATGKTDSQANLYGGLNDDTLRGSELGDYLQGGLGNDVISGNAGHDTIFGNEGADKLYGGDGNDNLYVDAADTVIDGGAGWDAVRFQGEGDFTFNVTQANVEHVEGSLFGKNVLDATGKTDSQANLYGGLNDDTLRGSELGDHLQGGLGNDIISGNGGNDTIYGGEGADELYGGDGNDNLYVDAADTVIDGGAGWDAVRVQGEGDFTLNVTQANAEHVEGSLFGKNVLDATGKTDSQVNLYGGLNDDTLRGSELGDNLYGGLGNDLLAGNGGNDGLDAGAGNDVLIGGAGNDTLTGGEGTDTAKFSGNRSDYRIEELGNGNYRVTDLRTGSADGSDTLYSIERLSFADATLDMSTGLSITAPTTPPTVSDGQAFTLPVSVSGADDSLVSYSVTQTSGVPVQLSGGLSLVAPQGPTPGGLVEGSNIATFEVTATETRYLTGATATSSANVAGGVTTDKVYWENGITVDGKLVEHGIGMHPTNNSVASAEWSVPSTGKFEATASVAMQAGREYGGTMAFRVYIDGELKFDSGAVSYKNDQIPVSIDVKAGQTLRLETDSLGTNWCDHAVWADAKFTRSISQQVSVDIVASENDTLTGTASSNTIDGGVGNDLIDGGGGNDRLVGGAGDDTLVGGDSDEAGSSLKFSRNGYVDIPGNEDLNFGKDDFSISVWVKTNTDGTQSIVSDQTGDGRYTGWHLCQYKGGEFERPVPNNSLIFIAGDYDGDYDNLSVVGTKTSYNDGEWHQVTVVKSTNDVNNWKIYVDGVEDSAVYHDEMDPEFSLTNNTSVRLGSRGRDDMRFTGELDSVQIHRTALDSSQVNEVAQGEVVADNLVVSFEFDDANVIARDGSDSQLQSTVVGSLSQVESNRDANNDRLEGGSGNDVLVGQAGNDILVGGEGNDSAVYSGNLRDYQIEKLADGSFRVSDIRPGSPDGVDTVSSIEQLRFADQTIDPSTILFGTNNSETIQGSANNDLIFGQAGNDTINAGAGDDTIIDHASYSNTYVGGEGTDTVEYSRNFADHKIWSDSNGSLLIQSPTGAVDTLRGVEFVQFGDQKFQVIYSGGVNGQAVSSQATGDLPIIFVDGNSIATYAAGTQQEVLAGSGYADTVSYATSNAGVTVNFATGVGSGGSAEGDRYVEMDNVVGSAHDDRFIDHASYSNTYVGGEGTDTVEYSRNFADHKIWSDSNGSLLIQSPTGAVDTLRGVEFVQFGDQKFQVIYSGGVNGQAVSSQATGDLPIIFVDGNSIATYAAGTQQEVIAGSGYADTVSYASSNAGVTVNFATGVGSGGSAEGDRYVEMDNVVGSAHDDRFIDHASYSNTYVGGEGTDTVEYSRNFADHKIWSDSNGSLLIQSPTGAVDTLRGVEFVQFGDQKFQVIYSGGVNGQAVSSQATGDLPIIFVDGNSIATYAAGTQQEVIAGSGYADTVSYATSNAGVTVNFATGVGSGGSAEGDRYVEMDNVIGSAHNDRFVDHASYSNTYVGGEGTDTVEYSRNFADHKIWSDSNGSLLIQSPTGAVDTLRGVEFVQFGDQKFQVIYSGGVNGQAVSSQATGDLPIIFVDGNSIATYAAGTQQEVLAGSGYADTVSYASSNAGVTVNFATGVGSGGSAEGDRYIEMDNVVGSAHNDRFIDHASYSNTYIGGEGTDTVEYSRNFADHKIWSDSNGSLLIQSPTGAVDTLRGVEFVQFGDQKFQVIYSGGVNGQSVSSQATGDLPIIFVDGNSIATYAAGTQQEVIAGSGYADTVSYASSNAGVTVNFATGVGSGGSAEGDRYVEMDNVVGSAHDDRFVDHASYSNTYVGGEGTDTVEYSRNFADYKIWSDSNGSLLIQGPSGAVDTLRGVEFVQFGDQKFQVIYSGGVNGQSVSSQATGDLPIIFVDGNSIATYAAGTQQEVIAGSGYADTVSYATSNAGVTVNFATGVGSGGSAEGDRYVEMDNVVGSAHDDRFVDHASYSNTYVGGEGTDTVEYSRNFADHKIWTDSNGSLLIQGPSGAVDTLRGVEFVKFADVTIDAATRNVVSQGTAGDDQLTGSNISQTLNAGAGDDVLTGAGGDDRLLGGSGEDTAVYSGNRNDYRVDKNADGTFTVTDLRSGSPDGKDTLVDIEQLRFADGEYDVEASFGFASSIVVEGTSHANEATIEVGETFKLTNALESRWDSGVDFETFQSAGPKAEVVFGTTVVETVASFDFTNGFDGIGGQISRTTAYDSPTGGAALLISPNGGASYRLPEDLIAGEPYKLSYWVRSVDGQQTVSFSYQDGSGKPGNLSHNSALTNEWQLVEKTVVLDASRPLMLFYGGAKGAVYDGIKLERLDVKEVEFRAPDSTRDYDMTFRTVAFDGQTYAGEVLAELDGQDSIQSNDWTTKGTASVTSDDAMVKLDTRGASVDSGLTMSLSSDESSEALTSGWTLRTEVKVESLEGDGQSLIFSTGTKQFELTLKQSGQYVVANMQGHPHPVTIGVVNGGPYEIELRDADANGLADLYVGGKLIRAAHAGLPTTLEGGPQIFLGSHTGNGGGVVQWHDVEFKALDVQISTVHVAANKVVDGTSGNDTLVGMSGNDTLRGSAGNDVLTGARGNDTLDGGEGIDTATYSGKLADYRIERLADGSTRVTDLRSGSVDGTDTLTNVERVQFANTTLDLTASKFAAGGAFSGSAASETIITSAGNDQISAGAGDDAIVSSAGSDVIDGGEGSDRLMLKGNRADYTLASNYDGSLSLQGKVAGLESITVKNVETLQFADQQVSMTYGTDGHDRLQATGEGSAVLVGGGLHDRFVATDAAEQFIDGYHDGIVDYSGSSAAVTIDLRTMSGSGGAAEGDKYQGITRYEGSGHGDTILVKGNRADYTLTSNYDGSLLLQGKVAGLENISIKNIETLQFADQQVSMSYGTDGHDRLQATGEGSAVLVGGGLHDRFVATNAAEQFIDGYHDGIVDYSGSSAAVTIDLRTMSGSGGAAEGDKYQGITRYEGSGHGDTILVKGNRADYTLVSNYDGSLLLQGKTAGLENISIKNIETLQFADQQVSMTYGTDGHDRLQATGEGPAVLVGGGLHDRFVATNAAEQFIDGYHDGIVDYSGSSAAVTIDLRTMSGSGGAAEGDKYQGITRYEGSGHGDTILVKGNRADYTLVSNYDGSLLLQGKTAGLENISIKNIETLQFADQQVSMTYGTDGHDRLQATGEGPAVLVGGGLHDRFVATNAAEQFIDGYHEGIVDYSGSSAAVTIDLRTMSGSGGAAEGDKYQGITRYEGSGHGDTILVKGNRADYTLVSNYDGSLLLQGKTAGLENISIKNIETLQFADQQVSMTYGTDGNDRMQATGEGPAVLVGGGLHDRFVATNAAEQFIDGYHDGIVDYSGSSAAVTIDLRTMSGSGGAAEGDKYQGITRYEGSGHGDTILVKGNRADYTLVSNYDGSLLLQGKTAGLEYISIKNIETLQFADQQVSMTYGTDGNDTLRTIGEGPAVLVGGGLHDRFVASNAAEQFIDGYHEGAVDYSASGDGVTIDLRTMSGSGGAAAGDTYQGITRFEGSSNDDVIVFKGARSDYQWTANADGSVTVRGLRAGLESLTLKNIELAQFTDQMSDLGTGERAVVGTVGNDSLQATDTARSVSGMAGDDTLVGSANADRLMGGEGDDRLQGGAGADRLTGGEGRDTFVYGSTADGHDVVTDFELGRSGDVLKLGSVLNGSSHRLADYLKLESVSGGTKLLIDPAGTGNFANPSGSMMLTGVDASQTSLLQMLRDGNLVLDQIDSDLDSTELNAMSASAVQNIWDVQLETISAEEVSRLDANRSSWLVAYHGTKLSVDQLEATPGSSIQNLDVKNVPVEIFDQLSMTKVNQLSAGQMQSLPASHVSSLSGDEVSRLDANHSAWLVAYHGPKLSLDQLEATPGSSIQNLDVKNVPVEIFDQLSMTKVNQLSAGQMQSLPVSHVNSLSADEVSRLDSNHSAWLVAYHGPKLSLDQLEATPGSSIQNLDVKNVPVEIFDQLSMTKVNQLSAGQMQSLPASHVGSLSGDEVSRLDSNHSAWLVAYHGPKLRLDQLEATPGSSIQNLDVKNVPVEIFDQLSMTKVNQLSAGQMQSLPVSHVNSLSGDEVSRLDSNHSAWLVAYHGPKLRLDQLEATPGSSIQNLDVKDVPVEIFDQLSMTKVNQLSAGQMQSLPASHVNSLSGDEVSRLDSNHSAWLVAYHGPKLRLDQLEATPGSSIQNLNVKSVPVEIFDQLSMTKVNQLSAGQMQSLPASHVSSLSGDEVSRLDSNHSTWLVAYHGPKLRLDQLEAAPGSSIQNLDVTKLPAEVFDDLSIAKVNVLSSSQIRNLPASHVDSFSADEVAQLDSNHSAWLVAYHGTKLDADQLNSTMGSSIQNLDIARLPAAVFDGLSTAKMNVLSDTQFRNLTAEQVETIDAEEISQLDASRMAWLKAYHWAKLSGEQVSGLSDPLLRSIDVVKWSAETVSELSAETVSRLSDAQLQRLSESQIAQLSTEQLDVSRLTHAQRSYLSLAQIEAAMSASTWTDGTAGSDTLTGSTDVNLLAGASGDDQLSGGAGRDVLRGDDGDDWLAGGQGTDLLIGGEGRDTADYRESSAGVSIDLNRRMQQGGDAEGDALVDIENVRGSEHNDAILGDDEINLLWGGAGDDSLLGGGGSDTLAGGWGDDFVDGGEGDDLLVAGLGFDRLQGGEGIDTVSYRDLPMTLSIDPTVGRVIKGLGFDVLEGIELIEGSDVGNVFTFAAPEAGGEYHVKGGAGIDTLDLSAYSRSDVQLLAGRVEVRLSDGSTFAIVHDSIDRIVLSEGELSNVGVADQSLSTTAGQAIRTSSVLASAYDLDGDELRVGSFTQPSHGKVTMHDDGSFTYVPNDGEFGADSFTVTVVDADGNESVAVIRVEVKAPGILPVSDSSLPEVSQLEVLEKTERDLNATSALGNVQDSSSEDEALELRRRFDADLLDSMQESGVKPSDTVVPQSELPTSELEVTESEGVLRTLEQLESLERQLAEVSESEPSGGVALTADELASLSEAGALPDSSTVDSEGLMLQGMAGALGGMLMGMVGLQKDKTSEEEKKRQPEQVRSGLKPNAGSNS